MTKPVTLEALQAAAKETVIAHDVLIVRYPFVREMREAHWLSNGDGTPHPEIECWIPGITHVEFGPEDTEAVAHGEGEMHLRIVSAHKPGRYPERVFYEGCFVDPDGTTFSRPKLHIATRQKFKRICKGYQ